MTRFNRFVSMLMAGAMLVTFAAAPRRAHAVVAALSMGTPAFPVAVPLVIMGAGLATGVAGTVVSATQFQNGGAIAAGVLFSILTGLAAIAFGWLLLDTPGGTEVRYAALTDQQATQLGVSADEAEQYRQDLPEINAIAQQISQDVQHDGVTELNEGSLRYAAAKWAAYGAGLAPASLKVVQKIGANVSAHVNGGSAAGVN